MLMLFAETSASYPLTWKPVRNAHSRVSPDVYWINPLGKGQHLCVNKGDSKAHSRSGPPGSHSALWGVRVEASEKADEGSSGPVMAWGRHFLPNFSISPQFYPF